MRSNRVFVLILLVGMLVIAAGCGGNQANNSNNQANGDDNTANNNMNNDTAEDQDSDDDMQAVVLSGDLVLDPALLTSDDISSLIICDYLYDGLVVMDSDGSVGVGLAESWDESDDGLAYEFRLRTNAVFSDGKPVTADVVLDNFNRWFDPDHRLHGSDSAVYKSWLQYFAGFLGELDADDKPISLFDGIEKVDDRTVLVHLNEPMPEFLETISLPFFSILNPAALEAGDYGMSASSVDGTGAYSIAEWTDTGLTLEPNNDFWGDVPTEDMQFIFE